MKTTALLVSLVFASSLCSFAKDEGTIDHVTEDNVIILQDGQAYQSADATSLTWLPSEEVLVLDDGRIVNKDENETIDAIVTAPLDEDAEEDDADSE